MSRSASNETSPADPLRPWPPYKFVSVREAADFLGVTEHWIKRARAQGFLGFARLRNVTVIQAAGCTVIDEGMVPATLDTETALGLRIAVLVGLVFPGDVMATIDTSSQAISSTVSLENGSDNTGQLVSDGTLGYAWVTDETSPTTGDIVQNLNLAVSDPAGQPYVTAVGGTSLSVTPTQSEKVWNDALNYSEGAAGGGISQSFPMPAYQQPLGTVSGSSGTPCANSSGNCREIPDVSADADPSTGYIVYDDYNYSPAAGLHWVGRAELRLCGPPCSPSSPRPTETRSGTER